MKNESEEDRNRHNRIVDCLIDDNSKLENELDEYRTPVPTGTRVQIIHTVKDFNKLITCNSKLMEENAMLKNLLYSRHGIRKTLHPVDLTKCQKNFGGNMMKRRCSVENCHRSAPFKYHFCSECSVQLYSEAVYDVLPGR